MDGDEPATRCFKTAWFGKVSRKAGIADELVDFRQLAKTYASLSASQLGELLDRKDLTEICHDAPD